MKGRWWLPGPVRHYARRVMRWYGNQQERRHSRKILHQLKVRLRSDPAYQRYLDDQIVRSWKRRSWVSNDDRAGELISRFLAQDRSPREERRVLCVGCRNVYELDLFRNAGFEDVVGIDLFSLDPAILQMDMHVMTFQDNSFDVLFSCHSLEHSFDPQVALREFARVLKSGGVCIIEVPIRFPKKNAADLQDFGSLEALEAACSPFLGQVLFAEEERRNQRDWVARIAFIMKDDVKT